VDFTTGWLIRHRMMISCGGLAFLALVLSLIYIFMLQQTVTRYRVITGTEALGSVSSPNVVWEWLERKKREISLEHPTVQAEVKLAELHFVEEREYKAAYDNSVVIAELEKRTYVQLNGVQISIDGRPLGFVRDEAAAQALLDQVKRKYMNGGLKGKVRVLSTGESRQPAQLTSTAQLAPDSGKDDSVIESVQFVQKVELAKLEVNPARISDGGELLNIIETGGVQPLKYKVQPGDCISCIAYKFHISNQVIYDNNPSIKNNLIRAGEELDLTVLQPLLSVKTLEKRVETVEVPYEIAYIEDPTLKAGLKETVAPGENGLKEVTYVTTKINGEFKEEAAAGEKILIPMIQAVMRRGTKVIPGVGTGTFAWPVYRAKLTSEFGKRWGAFHPGTDMVSDNTAIMAADHGKTVFAGWKTGYGNCIMIDHQNGFSTLYGHLSKIAVKEGEMVQKGEKIGVMGTTGNSTGVHLHFEVRKGEAQENPLHYLGS
jgi:murein DD-endopeptidase MepM/ murein hydrolase activator NlpD